MPSGTERREGTLTTWNDDRGFGFLTPNNGEPSIFMHVRALPWGSERPHAGEKFTYEVQQMPDGKIRANMVLPVGVKVESRPNRHRQSALSYVVIIAFLALYLYFSLRWTVPLWVAGLYIVTSILCYFVYASDKNAATEGRWRTSESSLLALGLVGGWPGAIFAQQRLRHKTRKISFQLAFWGTVVLNVLCFSLLTSPWFAALIRRLTGQ